MTGPRLIFGSGVVFHGLDSLAHSSSMLPWYRTSVLIDSQVCWLWEMSSARAVLAKLMHFGANGEYRLYLHLYYEDGGIREDRVRALPIETADQIITLISAGRTQAEVAAIWCELV